MFIFLNFSCVFFSPDYQILSKSDRGILSMDFLFLYTLSDWLEINGCKIQTTRLASFFSLETRHLLKVLKKTNMWNTFEGLAFFTVHCVHPGWDPLIMTLVYHFSRHGPLMDGFADLWRGASDHHRSLWCWLINSLSLFLFPSLALAGYVRKQEGARFTGGSLKAIKEQHADRMRAVNRGKQGRAMDTVTHSTPPPHLPCLLSITHTHTHPYTFALCYLLHTALPMAPHIFQLAPALSSANSRFTPLWPERVMNRHGDNTFFTLLLSLSLCLTPYLLSTLFVFTSLCPFSPHILHLVW